MKKPNKSYSVIEVANDRVLTSTVCVDEKDALIIFCDIVMDSLTEMEKDGIHTKEETKEIFDLAKKDRYWKVYKKYEYYFVQLVENIT